MKKGDLLSFYHGRTRLNNLSYTKTEWDGMVGGGLCDRPLLHSLHLLVSFFLLLIRWNVIDRDM